MEVIVVTVTEKGILESNDVFFVPHYVAEVPANYSLKEIRTKMIKKAEDFFAVHVRKIDSSISDEDMESFIEDGEWDQTGGGRFHTVTFSWAFVHQAE